jgi:TolA-binding protein
MFKQLVEVTRQALFLLRDVEQNKQDIATLKEQLAETNKAVTQLAHELQRSREREKLLLRLDNALLRFERMLPAARSKKRK